MTSVSKAQQRFMGLVHAYKKGEVPASKVSQAVKDAAKSMKKKSTKKMASTKHKGLPNKVRSENMNEDGHTDVASAERKLKLIMKDAMDTLNALRSLSNEDSLPSWWTDKITLAKDYVGKSRDYIMNPAESVNEGNLDKIASTLVADLNKEFTRYNPKKISDFNKVVKYLGKKMPRVPKSKIEDIAMTFDEIMRDEAGNVVVNSREQRARMKSTLKKLGMKESVNEESKTIKSIQNLADKNKYGTVSGTRMNGKTAREIIAIYNHPKMKSFRGKMDKLKSHELMDLTIRLPKILGIKVESVNEKTISIGGEDLMKYLMKRFKMSKSQAIASMKKHKMDMSFLKKESVNEAVEPRGNIKKVLDVAKNKQAKKIGGTLVDGTTANMMTQVWNKVNDSSKEKMNKMNTKQLINLILRMWKAMGTPRV